MSQPKVQLLRTIQLKMVQSSIPDQTARIVTDIIVASLKGYTVNEEDTSIIVYDDKDERILKTFGAVKLIEGRSKKSINRYIYIIKRMLKTVNKKLEDIDVFVLRQYLAQLTLNGNSVNTIAGISYIFKSFFSWAAKEGFITHDPSDRLESVKQKKKVELPFTNYEIEVLRTKCENKRDRALLEFLRSTGCRIEEVCRLNSDDIDFRSKSCKVLGKGNKERIVYIDDTCSLHLHDYLTSRPKTNDALFDGRATDRITPGGVRAMLKRLESETSITNVHPHRFRRTLATNMIRKGMKIQDVAHILGHSKLDTTMIYVHTDESSVENEYRRCSI